ncbi:uncharacterized protein Bfra_006538 [Botrytis fragariae]|uniref:Uncharacterized protein n=1 Tax=Botrytis fragariae TaxID=1964551 RepID=A0A8H6EPE2_9HELO|nr:uncharacterized protein Bfra_006538 [Botrytis fragariae]KAF5879330.1 hypothetical protein Bfra_006538 [Botrytis fragariae]
MSTTSFINLLLPHLPEHYRDRNEFRAGKRSKRRGIGGSGEDVSRDIELREGDWLERLRKMFSLDANCATGVEDSGTENENGFCGGFADLLECLEEPANGYTNLMITYEKGLQMNIKF